MKTSKNDYAVEIYLFYPNLDKLEKKGNFNYFFKNLNDIDKQLDNCVIFLSLQTAMHYSHFMHTSHVILKVRVPQIAINGHEHGLTLKKGFLTKKHIEGCFPCGKKGMLYLKNPEFDIASL